MKKLDDIMPCPFCGGESEMDTDGPDNYALFIECTQCGTELGHTDGKEDKLIEAWNTRWTPND